MPTLAFGGWQANNYSTLGLATALGAFVGGLYAYWTKPNTISQLQAPIQKKDTGIIKEFNYERDKDAVLALFDANRKFLEAFPDYDLNDDLKSCEIVYACVKAGDLKIKVVYEGEKLAGFVTYYIGPTDPALIRNKRSAITKFGVIPMLCIGERFRNKGYAKQLGEFVRNDLRGQGISEIRWNVHKENAPAIAWYKKLGARIVDSKRCYECFYTIAQPARVPPVALAQAQASIKKDVGVIKEFNYEQDKDAVLALFEADRKFLEVSHGYNLDHDLKTRSVGYAQVGKDFLQIKVLYEGEQLAGFITYYVDPNNSDYGVMPMLCVGKKFRRKEYATQLFESAKNCLKQWGVSTMRWNVLKSNPHVRAWYERLGAHLHDCGSYYRCTYIIHANYLLLNHTLNPL